MKRYQLLAYLAEARRGDEGEVFSSDCLCTDSQRWVMLNQTL